MKSPGEVLPGAKDDAEKDRYDLIPLLAQEQYVKVLTVGARKYAPENWRLVPQWDRRYYAAALRHLTAWMKWNLFRVGSRLDDGPGGTGLPHLACAMCCVAFLLELDELRASLLARAEKVALSSQDDRQDKEGLRCEKRSRKKPLDRRPDEGRG